MGDTGNALLATIAIIAALYYRDRTGQAQAVSTSIVNAGILHTSYAWVHSDGREPDWGHVDGEQFGLSPYYRLYRCARWANGCSWPQMTQEERRSSGAWYRATPEGENAEAVAAWLGSLLR